MAGKNIASRRNLEPQILSLESKVFPPVAVRPRELLTGSELENDVSSECRGNTKQKRQHTAVRKTKFMEFRLWMKISRVANSAKLVKIFNARHSWHLEDLLETEILPT